MNDQTNNRKNQAGNASEEADDEITQTASPDEIDAGAAKIKELEEKYLRTYADLENYRKRVAKEKEEIRQDTSERLFREMLEVKDHLELALSHAKGNQHSPEFKGLREGVELTLKQLQNFLKKFGVEEVPALGVPFDPAFHEAIHQEESKEYKPGYVVHVYQKGYVMNGRLLRAARVTVSSETSRASKEPV